MISFMVVLKAHFDGKVFVPDEPVSLAPNQKVRVITEPDSSDLQSTSPKRTDWHSLIGIALEGPTNPDPRFPNDDALWEGSLGDTLSNDPRKLP
jgi:hypothetical protein